MIFLLLVALSVSVAAQIVGSLLIFILLTLPAASAKYFTTGTAKMIGLAILFALTGTWTGLYLGYLTNWPVSFFIAVIEVGIYLAALANRHRQADYNLSDAQKMGEVKLAGDSRMKLRGSPF